VTAAVRVRTPSPVQDSKVYVAVISAGRAGNVPKMEAHLEGVPHQWVVPQGQEDDYRAMGAADVWGTFSKQDTHQRNAALDIAGPLRYCIQTDDDLKRLEFVMPGGKPMEITFASAIEALITACELNDAYYAGIAPTNNAYFTRNLYNLNGFIRSALTAYRPGSALRYDHQFPLKGDYDLTCQHLRKFGRVARVDGLLGTFAFGQGAGGCVDYRTPQLEDLVIERLMAKWPGKFKPNPKRPGEVRFRWTKDDVDDSVKPEKNSRVATGQMEMW
jgi:hypothetical protein